MKAYTDLEQSKKLAEILPVDSADMSINHSLFHNMTTVLTTPYKKLHEFFSGDTPDTTLPCWSLAALLDQLEDVIYDEDGHEYQLRIIKEGVQYYLIYDGMDYAAYYDTPLFDDFIDACYEMILNLHEQKLI